MKYKLTNNFINVEDKKLYRIEASKDFSIVKKGQLGGYIESEENLSQEGNCWIFDKAKVFDNAKVAGNAYATCDAKINYNLN